MRRMTRLGLLLAALLLSLLAPAQQDVITTAIGGGPNGIPALRSNLYTPDAVAVDATGNYYISAYYQNRVFKVNTAGTLTVLAGNGAQGFGGDGVAAGAPNAYLYHPYGLAVDASGNVYVADTGNCVVRKISTANTITTIAGIGNSCGFSGDGAAGTSAQLYSPGGVALDGLGNLFIADTSNCRIRKLILSSGIISTYAGNGTCGYSGDTAAATSAQLYSPYGVAADTAGNVFIADTSNYVIREVTKADGKINTIAGNHSYGFGGDGATATSAQISTVYGLGVNTAGTIVTIADYNNYRVRQFTVGGKINTVAGNGTGGFGGDGTPATSANLNGPQGIGVSSSTIYLADASNNRIRKFTVGGNISTVAGNGSQTLPTLVTGVPVHGAVFNYPYGVFRDTAGNMFVNDTSDYMVRELVATTNLVNFFAGTGTPGFLGDGAPATSAELSSNYNSVKDSKGNLYIADTNNCVIRMVNTAGNISSFAGIGQHCGYTGDGGSATSAELYYPYGLAVDSKDNVYIADSYNHVIREVVAGRINTIAGIGQSAGYSGDGGPATAARLYYPYGVSVDPVGNVFIADTSNCRIREVVASTGVISTIAGTASCGYNGDGVATQVSLNSPQGISVDANDNIFIADTNNHRLRWISPLGMTTTFAGSGSAGFYGDGGPATSAQLYYPSGIDVDPAGNVLVADQYNYRIRKVQAFAALGASRAALSFPLTPVGTTSSPQPVTISAVGPLTIADITVSGSYSEVDDCPLSMANGTTCTLYVYYTPTASGTANGTVTITTNGFFSPTSTISMSGQGTAISITGAPASFGNQLVKTTSAAKAIKVTNTGTTAITMSTITLSDATDFAISSNTCPAPGSTLAGGTFCTINATFKPASTGLIKGTILIKDNDPSTPQLVGLSGTGISDVALSPTSATFASTAIGSISSAAKITVTNNTAGSITLSTPAVTLTGPFVNSGATTCTNGLVIATHGSCLIYVIFKPTVVGLATGTVKLNDSDSTSPQTATLRGTGTGIKFTPTSIAFGIVNRGTQVSNAVTIKNVGTTTITFTGAEITGVNSIDFSQNGGAVPCSGSLLAGASCTFNFYYLPSVDGSEVATYKLFDNSPGSPQILYLTGTGQN